MNWSRGHIIGHGCSATVFLATSSRTSEIFAVKSSEISKSELLQREQKILSSLSSPHIVGYKGCDVTTEKNRILYNIFMEYMPFGTLIQATRRDGGGRPDESMIAYYTRQILQGIEYLHSNGLVHCDIKGANILIGEDGAKIADFGCAKWVNEAGEATAAPIRGTPMFMAPEVARGEEQSYPCDIWSLGCTVIEMASGVSAWPNVADPVSVLYRIAYSGEVPEIPGFLSEQAKDFLEKCLKRNPRERWTASQLLKHPFLVEFSSCEKKIQESNSSSPTSILDQGIWNCVEESESVGNLIHTSFENSASDRIRKLADCSSGGPSWRWDENWVTIRGNDEEAEDEIEEAGAICGAETASTSDGVYELEKTNVSESRVCGYFCEDFKCRQISVGSFSFQRCIDKMLLHLISHFL